MPPALFDIAASVAPWVVRDAVTGHVHHVSDDRDDCEHWCDDHRSTRYVAIERRDQCLGLDRYIERGMLRNYPGERKRKPASRQLGMFA